jgi:glutathione S-transferase
VTDNDDQSKEIVMLVLFGAGEGFGLPEISPYVTKSQVHLKMAGLEYEFRRTRPDEAPKGQMPFIEDRGFRIGDSAYIRSHIEVVHGADLDAGLTAVERAQAFAVEMMCDHQLAPMVGYFRWLHADNFDLGPAMFFADIPEPQRTAVIADVKDRVREAMRAKGIARHQTSEILDQAARAFEAVETLLGDKPYLFGDKPCGADAMAFACLAGIMTPHFETPARDLALTYPTLVAYVERMMGRFYPDFAWTVEAGKEAKAA